MGRPKRRPTGAQVVPSQLITHCDVAHRGRDARPGCRLATIDGLRRHAAAPKHEPNHSEREDQIANVHEHCPPTQSDDELRQANVRERASNASSSKPMNYADSFNCASHSDACPTVRIMARIDSQRASAMMAISDFVGRREKTRELNLGGLFVES